MQTYLDCYPCFLRQTLQAARFAGADEATQATLLRRVMTAMLDFDAGQTPPEMSVYIHELVREATDDPDPYAAVKAESTQEALALVPQLRAYITRADDPLDVALRIAIAGNIIDFGAGEAYALQETIDRMLTAEVAVDHRDALRAALQDATEVLYLADNAGETVFDRLLIETLEVPVTYVVKGGPAINDATWDDAVAAGVDTVATLMSNGAQAVGTLLARCSEEFRRTFEAADLVLAKGQANYETLSDSSHLGLFFLLQVKCPVIGRDLDTPVGSMIVKQADLR
jgi:uncharacterized protein with ATP-grasp and redox domains